MVFFLSMYALSILGFIIHLYILPSNERTYKRTIELMLLYQLVFSVGMTSLLAFVGYTFMPEYVAKYNGWPTCPFQQELGNVNLAFGVLGIMCIWFRDHFWTATILGFSIRVLGDGVHHIYDMIANHNYTPGCMGVSLITDLAVPIILLLLLAVYRDEIKRDTVT